MVYGKGGGGLGGINDLRAAQREQLQRSLERAAGAFGGRRPETQLVEGDPVDALSAAAAEASLLVVGSCGYGPLGRVLLGATHSKLLDLGPLPDAGLAPSCGGGWGRCVISAGGPQPPASRRAQSCPGRCPEGRGRRKTASSAMATTVIAMIATNVTGRLRRCRPRRTRAPPRSRRSRRSRARCCFPCRPAAATRPRREEEDHEGDGAAGGGDGREVDEVRDHEDERGRDRRPPLRPRREPVPNHSGKSPSPASMSSGCRTRRASRSSRRRSTTGRRPP